MSAPVVVYVVCPFCEQTVDAEKVVGSKSTVGKIKPHKRRMGLIASHLFPCPGGQCSIALTHVPSPTSPTPGAAHV